MSDNVLVNFGMERRYVFDVLTSDISTADSLLDLIDNSIDAARRDIGATKRGASPTGLPDSYEGYFVDIWISQERIEIRDNCQGMEEHLLADKAFRLGARHEQRYSIGIYGVGLIRAFWKLGNSGCLLTDTGSESFKLTFSKEQIQDEETPLIPAERDATSGSKTNHLVISDITEDAFLDVADPEWIAYFCEKVRRVFGLCIRKGLTIRVNDASIREFGPRIRPDIKPLSSKRLLHTTEGVLVEIETGVHEQYLFAGEPGHSADKNKILTKEFGWYIVCNDRIVLIADLSEKVGWTKVWHSEYNGFVGWAHFICSDPKLLPWDSKKTDISLEKRAQREVAPTLRDYADLYRQKNRHFRYVDAANGAEGDKSTDDAAGGGRDHPGHTEGEKKGSSSRYSHTRPSGEGRTKPETKKDGSVKESQKKPKKGDHNEAWEMLFPEVFVCHNDNKLKALVVEAMGLPLAKPYAATTLFRVTVERLINTYVKRAGKYKEVKKFIFDELERKEKEVKEDRKKLYQPQLSHMVSWVCNASDLFPEEHAPELLGAMKKLKDNLNGINKVVHEGELTSSRKLSVIRDDCWPVIKFMLENDPTEQI
ncbi:ATP-binding protein [Azospirillum sp. Marseille-Q6669]